MSEYDDILISDIWPLLARLVVRSRCLPSDTPAWFAAWIVLVICDEILGNPQLYMHLLINL